jgi:hypothetical protein
MAREPAASRAIGEQQGYAATPSADGLRGRRRIADPSHVSVGEKLALRTALRDETGLVNETLLIVGATSVTRVTRIPEEASGRVNTLGPAGRTDRTRDGHHRPAQVEGDWSVVSGSSGGSLPSNLRGPTLV